MPSIEPLVYTLSNPIIWTPENFNDLPKSFRNNLITVRHDDRSMGQRVWGGIKIAGEGFWAGIKLTGEELIRGGTKFMGEERSRYHHAQGSKKSADKVMNLTPKIITRGSFYTPYYVSDEKKLYLGKNFQLETSPLACKDNQAWQAGIISTLNDFPLRVDTLHEQCFINALKDKKEIIDDEKPELKIARTRIRTFLLSLKNLTELLDTVQNHPDKIDMDSPSGERILNAMLEYRQARRAAKGGCKQLGIHIYDTTERNIRMVEGVAYLARPVYAYGRVFLGIPGAASAISRMIVPLDLTGNIFPDYTLDAGPSPLPRYPAGQSLQQVVENLEQVEGAVTNSRPAPVLTLRNGVQLEKPLLPDSIDMGQSNLKDSGVEAIDVLDGILKSVPLIVTIEFNLIRNAVSMMLEYLEGEQPGNEDMDIDGEDSEDYENDDPQDSDSGSSLALQKEDVADIGGLTLSLKSGKVISRLTPEEFALYIDILDANELKETSWNQWSRVTSAQFTALLKRLGVEAIDILNSVKSAPQEPELEHLDDRWTTRRKEKSFTQQQFITSWAKKTGPGAYRSVADFLPDWAKEISVKNLRATDEPIVQFKRMRAGKNKGAPGTNNLESVIQSNKKKQKCSKMENHGVSQDVPGKRAAGFIAKRPEPASVLTWRNGAQVANPRSVDFAEFIDMAQANAPDEFNGDNFGVSELTSEEFANIIDVITHPEIVIDTATIFQMLAESNWDQWKTVTPEQFTALLRRVGSNASAALDSVQTQSLQVDWRFDQADNNMVMQPTSFTRQEFIANWAGTLRPETYDDLYHYLPDWAKEITSNNQRLRYEVVQSPIGTSTQSQPDIHDQVPMWPARPRKDERYEVVQSPIGTSTQSQPDIHDQVPMWPARPRKDEGCTIL